MKRRARSSLTNPIKGGQGESPEPGSPRRQKRRGLAASRGPLALAEWLEELALYGTPKRNPLDAEIAYQASVMVENRYLVGLSLNLRKMEIARRATART